MAISLYWIASTLFTIGQNLIVKKLAEKIGITGFAEFDLKYDERTNDFKLLEINPRQGRSSYYLTSLGCNLVEILKKDLIDKEKLDYQVLDKEVLLYYFDKDDKDLRQFIKKNFVVGKSKVSKVRINKNIALFNIHMYNFATMYIF